MDRLIYPCRCRDIARLVHRRCLLNRLQNTNERQCRICLTDFTAGRMEKQELLKLKCKQVKNIVKNKITDNENIRNYI